MWPFWRVMIVICAYGFLKEFKPTEPFLYEFEHITLNISSAVLSADVYPIWTYSYLAVLIPVFLLTDLLLYKPVLILEALSYLVCWLILDFGSSVLTQQFLEFFYGVATATEVAYFAYLYVAVEKSQYKRVTSFSRAALLGGKFSSYLISQLIILLKWGDYRMLNWITTGSLILAFLCSLLLPMISWRDAYEKRFPDTEVADTRTPSYSLFVRRLLSTQWKDVITIYSNTFTLKWSLWWALASCIDYQVQNYIQTLWGDVQTEDTQYNGFCEAAVPLVALPVVLALQKLTVRWHIWGESTLAVISVADAGILLWLAFTPSIFVMYVGYIAYRVLFESMMTISQREWQIITHESCFRFNLAASLSKDSFGILFGLNTFAALVLQSILTYVVSGHKGLHLPIREQFYVYSGFHVVVALIFAVASVFTWYFVYKNRATGHPTHIHQEESWTKSPTTAWEDGTSATEEESIDGLPRKETASVSEAGERL